jgi:precorrin-4 methylase
MFGLFKTDPLKKLRKEYAKKMEHARDVQRSGDLKLYARLMEENEALAKKIEDLNKKQQ